MNTSDRILFLLKTRGPKTAQQLAGMVELTSMGARRHLEAAEEKGLVAFEDVAEKVGRPSRRWLLTDAGHARFPDRHADLTVALIDQVKALFGDEAMDRLIVSREAASEAFYRDTVGTAGALPERVAALAQARDVEGYMAEVETQPDGSLLLVENHCPICAAARVCQNFCRSELEVFRRVLGPGCSVERTEHQLSGARRCAYRIVPV
ncbi:MarR family transcriptional regulator [Massilia dura]|uniref:MarR family transcriptional regulator n=1 Tax=Pseudoduganella dura TaxID=321982 RepID=A0A6I3XM12_9BURK|nr:metalloregulator ArsR/SmtB family transcription factor [Pseudoduganella dura]MUI15580.1 MarR family transcriptional regulator [Pseudoduganella dura]GGY13038.1 transcriptional regulator [Pseudoduganella dura]